jgi:hypothetical protein
MRLLGRPGLKPKLELRRQLPRDFGNRTLAAKLKHYRIERHPLEEKTRNGQYSIPLTEYCRVFLGQRRGARRLESIQRVVAATVG